MDDDSDAGEWSGAGDAPRRSVAWRQVRKAVPALAVIAISVAGVLASVMQPRALAPIPAAPRATDGVVQRPAAPRPGESACANCGVVLAVVPLDRAPQAGGARFRLRIRMDDGSLRTVQQPGALAAGSRVLVAGGSAHVLPQRPGQQG